MNYMSGRKFRFMLRGRVPRSALSWFSGHAPAKYSSMLLLTLWVAAIQVCSVGAADLSEYQSHVSSALDLIAIGECPASLGQLTTAGIYNGGDPLYVTAMGLALLSGGLPADAMREFGTAANLDKTRAEPVYGEGLIRLSEGKLAEAVSCFVNCGLLDVRRGARGAIEYARLAAGGKHPDKGSAGDDPTLMALVALGLESSGLWEDALELWQSVLDGAGRWTYRESSRAVMTFDFSNPVRFTGVPVKSSKPSIASRAGSLTEVSGVTTLNADVRKAAAVELVSFYVDGRLVGLTNSKPFVYEWDTATTSNGPHTIRIEGASADGLTLTSKTLEVLVRNNPAPETEGGSAHEQLYDQLWDLMTLRPSVAAVNFHIARCAEKTSDVQKQRLALIRCVAANPGYADAASQLEKLAGKANAARLPQEKSAAVLIDFGTGGLSDELADALAMRSGGLAVAVSGTLAESSASLLRRIVSSGVPVVSSGYGHRAIGSMPFEQAAIEVFRGIASIPNVDGRSNFVLLNGRSAGKWASKLAGMGVSVIVPSAECKVANLAECLDKALKPGAVIAVSAIELRPGDLSVIEDAAERKGIRLLSLSDVLEPR